MYKTITLFAALAAWITGQFFIFTGHAQTGYFISFASIALGLIFYFRLWEKLTPGSTLQAQNLPAGCALIAVLLSIAGTVLAGSKPSISLWLFVFSGLFLLLAKPKNEKLFDYFKIPENPPESPKWEPWFVLALFIVTAFLRLYKLGDIPQAVGGNEGLILSNCGILKQRAVIPAAYRRGDRLAHTDILYGNIFRENFRMGYCQFQDKQRSARNYFGYGVLFSRQAHDLGFVGGHRVNDVYCLSYTPGDFQDIHAGGKHIIYTPYSLPLYAYSGE